MIAKGHDFPRVTLVGVVDADVGLGLPDFRAAERTFQLLTQVAGRAGRGDLAGEVILQSHLPDHYALRLACAQDYEAFFEREMEFRRTMGYPPATRAREPDRALAGRRQGGHGGGGDWRRRLREAAGGALPRAGARPRAAGAAAAGAPLPDPAQGPARRPCARRCAGRSSSATARCAGPACRGGRGPGQRDVRARAHGPRRRCAPEARTDDAGSGTKQTDERRRGRGRPTPGAPAPDGSDVVQGRRVTARPSTRRRMAQTIQFGPK